MLRLKRAIDVLGAVAGLVLSAPILAVLMLAVRRKIGSPVLFRQMRTGLHERSFALYKLRTMTDARDATGKLLPDSDRLTGFGRWLRRTSLDELPQFWNVLRGQMSLVGPRPLLPRYVSHYNAHQKRRHDVKPGLTGWAQIHGRNAMSWERKFDLDIWYVDHRSLALDALILARTAGLVFRGHGVSHPEHSTMPEFLASRANNSAD